ncbi:alcohol dehydrogenase catalytic domain-containing protein [Kribbella sp. VKM Ac-2568]|uniref:alcohol dehydrogenase catalytic domain-containing protein n=1 Tax=Kribbella sp. VKM Ac-2568 TaxID=2512219 RepID=UPI001053EF22|nr:alcohol dehydrogenase catalytic domain-containing protein [Kribbella sp. VKM Ac-2568]TCM37262.1 2-desacetyl-2-hydroxyethyl bacteriochlorophyllide A dehydrogenase [Kribbella sp. VKM Ac-2568]
MKHAQVAHRSVLVGPATSQLEEAEVRAPGPGELLIQVIANGLCASELPTWLGGPAEGAPTTLGHEPVGRVVEVGGGVDTVAIGDVVTGRLTASFAELIVAPAEYAVVVPPGLEYEAGIGEPLGCVVEALRRARLDTGDRVAVVGVGFMGLCLIQLLATSPIGELVAIDGREDAKRAALAYGASAASNPEDAAQLTDAFDVVFEVSGTQGGLDLATALTRSGGTLDIVGYHQGTRTVDLQAWNWKALDVVNGHVRDQRRLTESVRRGLAIAAGGRIDYASLFTHRYPLSDIDRAYADLRAKPDGFVKALIVMNEH